MLLNKTILFVNNQIIFCALRQISKDSFKCECDIIKRNTQSKTHALAYLREPLKTSQDSLTKANEQ